MILIIADPDGRAPPLPGSDRTDVARFRHRSGLFGLGGEKDSNDLPQAAERGVGGFDDAAGETGAAIVEQWKRLAARAPAAAVHTASCHVRHAPEHPLLYAPVQAHDPDVLARLEAEDRRCPRTMNAQGTDRSRKINTL